MNLKAGYSRVNLDKSEELGGGIYVERNASFIMNGGVIQGDPNECVKPKDIATRAEAAAMFQRFCEKVLNSL